MSDGFFLMHRGWRDNPVFKGEYSRADAWVWLIENACWKGTRHDIRGKTVKLERGQLCASREMLAEVWGWSSSAVERFLTRLKTEQMIERETGQGKSVITICNYAKYQDKPDETGQPIEQQTGQTSDRHRTVKEQGNKETMDEEAKASPSKRAKRDVFPALPDWMPIGPWEAYLKMRRRKGAWPTAEAVVLMIEKLDGWRTHGHDPGIILNNSTLNNWTGIFEPKAPQNEQARHSFDHPRSGRSADGAARALDRQLGLGEFAGEAGRCDPGEGSGYIPLAIAGPGAC